MDPIRRVGVIGAGVMGAGIAAQVANAGIPVVLLDIIPGAAATAVARMLKTEPAPFMHRAAARLVACGDLDRDLALLADCDWICEAIVEQAEAKRALYARLQPVRRPGAILSSNTSTIPLAALTEGMAAEAAAHFLVTHFFNPPRYMRLLELVQGPATRPEVAARIAGFADRGLGKTVIACRDRPGFIANRIGGHWLQSAVNHAVDLGLTVEEADAAMGRPMGIPKTGVFGLLDLVGLDLMPHVAASMKAALPAEDPYVRAMREHPVILGMIAGGRTGRKGKGGFYARERGPGGERLKRTVDLATGTYRDSEKPLLESLALRDLRALAGHPDRGGRYVRAVLLDLLGYAAALVPEVAEGIADVDAAMRLGYNWRYGPFELIDRLGASWLRSALAEAGRPVPPLLERVGEGGFYRVEAGRLEAFGVDGAYHPVPRPEGVLLLADIKRRAAPLARNGSASLWDLGEGVACLEFHSKMNALDPGTLEMLGTSVAMGKKGAFRALVIHNEGEHFSVGANLGLALFAANIAAWGEIEGMIEQGQKAMRALRDAPFPVVGAPSGMALGGGCEILLHCDAVQAHAESYIGLVEAGVGLIPGWGGCTSLLRRWAEDPRAPKGPMPPVAKAFEAISTAQVAKSAFEAREMRLLRPTDGITFNRDRVLAEAKARALALAEAYAPPAAPAPLHLPGASGRVALGLAVRQQAALGRATPHDLVVCDHLAETLTGGRKDPVEPVGEAEMHALERRNFMALLRLPATLARVEHMLETGRPLRN
ncbi:3-hydroxyacyl-CoA dehydrogenase/enoyl-CoA hydratase family protein [Roseicella sp. DB1501]|uniref:3-hydroxyacyl-CoA dehydrogenase/enoyl-CoA hydratase family protein n=1 Tax=Roseicella sp. DB1501 TaxID=2730925 RepID=UPI001491342D|nr:3-hydroxyacyl-CoA dehydrogenase/enoyl-CoA hydratase family protein [Roseicella sp. DB1501]NOG73845.1 3-hydroxyacyl-CoA dehydrogenase [Roseicella sp. DB1501]